MLVKVFEVVFCVEATTITVEGILIKDYVLIWYAVQE
jgi:hypothetical protein